MNAKENYQRWLNHPLLDESLKKEMEIMDEKQILDAFYTNIQFGTAGMRGVMGAGTNRLNIHTIRKATEGFARYIVANGKEDMGVAIGYDNRFHSQEFAYDVANVLASHNIKAYVFESLRPTPELSFAVRHLGCFGGVMITASHNPKQYNGYKLYDENGCQLVPELASKVISYINEIDDELSVRADVSDQQKQLVTVIGEEVDKAYYENVKSIQINKITDTSLKIVFSPEHGTSNIPVRTILKECGYNVIPVLEQCEPLGDFPNTKTPNPEEKGAYELAIELAKKEKADLILVCDPDADRMGVGVLHNGEYVILTGNQSGALLIEYIFSQRKEKGLLPDNGVMCNTVVTSDLGEKIASSYGVETEKTLTGFKYIGEKIEAYEQSKEKKYVFGYEESYGSLIEPFVRDKDAQQACLMLAEAASFYKSKGKTLCDILEQCYQKFGYYNESQLSIVLEGADGAEKMKKLMDGLRNNRLTTIADTKVTLWQDFLTKQESDFTKESVLEGYDTSDVLKYFLEDGSWIAVRPSGTEPKVKIYFCVLGDSSDNAKKKSENYHQAMKELTN